MFRSLSFVRHRLQMDYWLIGLKIKCLVTIEHEQDRGGFACRAVFLHGKRR